MRNERCKKVGKREMNSDVFPFKTRKSGRDDYNTNIKGKPIQSDETFRDFKNGMD